MTTEELKQLSGGSRKKQIAMWLADNGYEFQVGLDGWPRVLVKVVEQRLGLHSDNEKSNKPKQPDLSWIENA